jgi:uncharacterized protein
MAQADFRFYAQLHDFLPKGKLGATYHFEQPTSIKHMIEALGVPHTEVRLILVNGQPVDFSYIVRDGDQISVYPDFQNIDISPAINLQPEPLDAIRFVADVHVGRLAAYLRMLGFDTLYPDDYRDEELARLSSAEQRILLTRDRGLLKRNLVTHGYYVRETQPDRQLAEIVKAFNLGAKIMPFHRCTACNGVLEPIDKERIADRLMPNTREYYDEFRICRTCGKIYWKGSHYQRMQRLIDSVLHEIDAAHPTDPESE